MATPNLQNDATNQSSGVLGKFTDAALIMSDEFGGAAIKRDRWRDELMDSAASGDGFQASLVQASVGGHNTDGTVAYNGDGTINYNARPAGKRHAAHYNDHRDLVQYIDNGYLVMKGLYTTETDPTIDTVNNIPAYTDDKHSWPAQAFPPHPYADNRANVQTASVDLSKKVYTSWLNSCGYKNGDASTNFRHILDPNTPQLAFRYGFYEGLFDFTGMQKGIAHRLSMWLMPCCKPTEPNIYTKDKTYDGDASTGAEIDIFEYENALGGQADQWLLCKVIDGGPSSGTLNPELAPTKAFADHGVDLLTGEHTIAVWWKPDGIHWYLDGVEVNVDTTRVPKIAQALFFTREVNTGVKTEGDRPDAFPPFRQEDPGLYNDSIGKDPQAISNCVARIGYVRVWQDPALNGTLSSDDTNWSTPQVADKIDPDTPGSEQALGPTVVAASNEMPDGSLAKTVVTTVDRCTSLRIGTSNHVPRCLLTAIPDPVTPLDNIKNEYKSRVARWTALDADGNIEIEGVLDGDAAIEYVALPGSTLTGATEMKLEIFDAAGDPVAGFEPNFVTMASLVPLGQFRVGIDKYGGVSDATRPDVFIQWLDSPFLYRSWKLTIRTNLAPEADVDIRLRMLLMGNKLELERGKNFDYGSTLRYVTQPELAQTESRSFIPVQEQVRSRALDLSLSIMADRDRALMSQAEIELRGQPFIISAHPRRDGFMYSDYNMLARFEDALAYRHAFENRHEVSNFTVLEV